MRPPISIALAGLLGFCTYSSVALGQSWNGAYYCVNEVAGGLAYDAMTKKWKGAAFTANEKFVLRLQYKGRREPNPKEKWSRPIDEYQVTITKSGESKGELCMRSLLESQRLVGMYDSGLMEECEELLDHYVFNLVTGRFLRTYPQGYVDGRDTNANNPSISGGTCTKID